MFVYLISGITFGFAAAVQPGPLQTFIISRTLNHGWRYVIPAAFAPLISDAPIICLSLLVLSVLPIWMENLLHFAGGFFVLFLAWGAFKDFKNNNIDMQSFPPQAARLNLFKAVTVNLLNPNPYLAWSLVMGPLLLQGWRINPVNGIGLVAGFYGAMILTVIAIILLFSLISKIGAKITRFLKLISAIALAFFGIYQLWLGISALWLA